MESAHDEGSKDFIDGDLPLGITVSCINTLTTAECAEYGSSTCIISLVRFVQLITNATMDVTWSLGIVSVWSTAEPNLGIVSACMPTMKPLLRRFLPQGKTRSAKDSKQSGSSGSSSSKKRPSAIESFGSKGFNRLKNGKGHEDFRELDDDTSDHVPVGKPTGTQTQITSNVVVKEDPGIPLNAIKVKTNVNWEHASREHLRT
ncbi:MAG: hypothetical protein Q9201_004201 [Fulgogasparrea decipioides]